MMGDKIESKKIAIEAKVSTVPGHMGIVSESSEAKKIAKKIGLPVMIKASAGGGGKGMRVIYDEDKIADAFESTTNEARNSFGDDRIFIEKFIENPRHIEIQIIADKEGNVVCLGERECSIKRNNQKVIEEAPSPFIDPKTRKKMYDQSVKLAKKVDYFSAGTIEYVVDKDKNFYFLEMNTRLQVEHPVTELITGLDLVGLMIDVALDKKLPFTQDDIKLNGWAMESRIYAEDPARNFLPSSGRLNLYIEPDENEHVRVDTGIYEGGEVSMFYDAMIAKLCSYGKNRDEAIEHMKRALSNYAIAGISHNITFLETIMRNARFCSGEISTNFIKEEFSKGFLGNQLDSQDKRDLISTAMFIYNKNYSRNSRITGRLSKESKQINDRWVVMLDDESYLVQILSHSEEEMIINCDNTEIKIATYWKNGDKLFKATVNNVEIGVNIKSNNRSGGYLLQHSGSDVYAQVLSLRNAELYKFMPKLEKNAKPTELTSPITGKIIKFKVSEGDEVKAGQELLVIEAMKMENIICTDYDVKIKKIEFSENDAVGVGQTIISFA